MEAGKQDRHQSFLFLRHSFWALHKSTIACAYNIIDYEIDNYIGL